MNGELTTNKPINVDKFTWKPGDIVITKKGTKSPTKGNKGKPVIKW